MTGEGSGRWINDQEDHLPGDLVGRLPAGARKDLTDRQWQVLEPLLPTGIKPGRPPTWTQRQLIDGIRWWTRTGAPWRDVPARYGSWQRVYGLFRAWQRDGTWTRIVARLQGLAEAAGLISWDVSVDSTINRAHQHAAGARTDPGAQKEPPRWCQRGRTSRPRLGPVPGRADHEDPP